MFEREPIFHDRQELDLDGPITTTSTTFVDIPGATLSTADLGQPARYLLWVSFAVQQTNNNTSVTFRMMVNGVPEMGRVVDFGPNSSGNPQHATLIAQAENVEADTVLQLQWLVSAGTGQINDLVATIDGIPEIRVVPIVSSGFDSYLLEDGFALLKEDGSFLLLE